MSKKDRFSDLLSVSEPTGANQKSEIIAGFVNTGSQETVNTEIKVPERKKATFDMDKDLHMRFKVYAASKGVAMVDILERLISEYLDENQ